MTCATDGTLHEHRVGSAFDCSDLLALSEDTDLPVAFFDQRLECLAASRHVASASGRQTDKLVGLSPYQLFRPAVAAERADLAESVLLTGRSVKRIGMEFGRLSLFTFRPAVFGPHREPGVLYVAAALRTTERLAELVRAGTPWASSYDWGALANLCARELQVLSLVGRGIPAAQMTTQIGDGGRPLQQCRASLGRKTGQTTRAGLTRLAVNAGVHLLEPERIEEMMGERQSVGNGQSAVC